MDTIISDTYGVTNPVKPYGHWGECYTPVIRT